MGRAACITHALFSYAVKYTTCALLVVCLSTSCSLRLRHLSCLFRCTSQSMRLGVPPCSCGPLSFLRSRQTEVSLHVHSRPEMCCPRFAFLRRYPKVCKPLCPKVGMSCFLAGFCEGVVGPTRRDGGRGTGTVVIRP